MAKLVARLPDGTLREIKLDRDRITIGRRVDNDFCLAYPAVSADHAEIITVIGDSFLNDLGSTNGTLVNGQRVVKHFLRDHDEIDLGRIQLVYLANEDETVEPLQVQATDEGKNAPAPVAPESTAASDEDDQAQVKVASLLVESQRAAVDELLTELMESRSESSVAVDMPPTISVVPTKRRTIERPAAANDPGAGAFIEVMSGPNAGQITPMTKAEFVFGKAGATVAVIRRDALGHSLIPADVKRVPKLNGQAVPAGGARLSYGDVLEVGGVRLRFDRRVPL